MKKSLISVIVAILLILSTFASVFSAVPAEDVGKTQREVYIHAEDENPTGTVSSSTVVKNDPFNLYFAVDNPNKGTYNASNSTEVEKHEQPQYDLNGYTVRIYYDEDYFDLQSGVDADAPIDYTVPDKTITDTQTKPDTGSSGGNISETTGYSAYIEGAGYDSEIGLNYAYVTVFFYGSFLPQEQDDPKGTKWYNLCALPLVPVKNGTTRVRVELGGSEQKNSLVLFAKHKEGFPVEFEYTAKNAGVHTINIVDSARPSAPTATPLPADFVKGDKVKLVCSDSECTPLSEKHDIYYSVDGGAFEKYEGQELEFTKTTEITCYSVKKTDTLQENKSDVVAFRYEILPDKPILFKGNTSLDNPITNVYNSDSAFKVYCDTEMVYDGFLENDVNIYYTFSDVHAEEFTDESGKFKTDGSDPDTEWVKVEKSTGLSVVINKTTKIRLITVRENAIVGQELSEIAVYKLGIRPAPVTASPVSGTVNPTAVVLNAENGCEIFYTTDGSDPITNGVKYSEAIPVYDNIKIRAAAKKDGIYSEISDFDYTVTPAAENTVSSNYPSGEYEGGINVSLTTPKPDDKIYYTVDNGNTWNEYTGLISVTKNTDIRAKIEGETKEFEFSYVIKPQKPVFVPTSTYFNQADSVTVYCVETFKTDLFVTDADSYTLYYTVDGSDPKTSSTAVNTIGSSVDKAVIDINKKTVIKAAVKSGNGEWSEVSEHTYDVISYKLAEPIPTLEPGHYTADKMVTQFFREQNGTDIYYTISYGDVFTADPVTTEVGDTKLYGPGTDIELTSRMIIKAVAVNKSLGLKSDVAVFEYIVTPETPSLVSPYADKESGIYDEEITVKLYSTNPSDVISYKLNDGNWETYDSSNPLNINEDSVLYIKTSDDNVVSYTYEFVPKAPVSTLISGRYAKTPASKMQIKLPEGYSKDDYYLYFTDGTTPQDVLAPNGETMVFDITESKSYKAYVVDKNTNKRSKNAVFYYIVEGDNVLTGEIYTQNPYKVLSGDKKYISSHLLSEAPYNEGIKLNTATPGAQIKYKYTYTKTDNTTGGADYQTYNRNNPVMVTSSMKNIIISAYLVDALGNEIIGTDAVFEYEFVKLLIPQFSTTDFKITNDYPGNQNILIYYTTDGFEPDSALSAKVLYTDGDVITLTGDTTVKTVYYRACNESGCSACNHGSYELCPDGVYGDVGTFIYTAPVYVSTGGSGGGGSVTNKRKYTKDIFGNEHLTHISYIKGYPDGTVRADGNITREEVTTILYRIKDKEYEEPFIVSGDVFPDVQSDRWSSTEIEYMANDGVILGYPDGEFKPQKNLTRAEFAALICRFINGKAVKSEAEFLDVEKTHWAYSSISALHEMELVLGYEDGTFRPEKEITRAEVITVINKILGRKPLASYVKSQDFNPFNDLLEDKWYYVDVLEATITHDYLLNGSGYEYVWENWK